MEGQDGELKFTNINTGLLRYMKNKIDVVTVVKIMVIYAMSDSKIKESRILYIILTILSHASYLYYMNG